MKPILSFFSVLLFICSNYLAFAQQKMEAAWESTLQEYQQSLAEAGVVGSSLYLVQNGEVRKQAFYGLADQESNTPVTQQTIYHWASITKTFTGIAVMQLRDKGLLKLDDPAVDYLPELKMVHNSYGDMSMITIRHLMSHTAGFRASTWPWGGGKDWHPYEPTSWDQLVAMLPYTRIQFEPGSQYSYSNPGIIFLGKIIEQLSGEDIEVYIEKRIFRPLKMHHSYFDLTPDHLLPYRSNNYFRNGDQLLTNGKDFDTGITVSNGGLNAPVPDMLKYLYFLLDQGDKANYPYVLSRASLEEMWKVVAPVSQSGALSENIGLHFFVLDHEGKAGKTHRFIGHTGSQRGFQSFFYIHPGSGSAAIMCMNTDVRQRSASGSESRSILFRMRELVFGDLIPVIND